MRRSLLALPFLLVACYRYAPIEPAAVRPGMEVRARVSAAAADRLAPLVGNIEGRLVAGPVLEVGPTNVILEVPTMVRSNVGSTFETLHQRVSLERSDVLEFESRRLDRVRTGAIAASGVVVAAAVLIKATRGGPGKDRLPDGGGVDRIALPSRAR